MHNRKNGFTLIEILMVVAVIAILTGVVILAINPTKQLGDTRNAQRRLDTKTILDAVLNYISNNNGTLPAPIPLSTHCPTPASNEICKTGAASCKNLVDLSALTENKKYLLSLPIDPTGFSANGSGYYIVKDANNHVTVCAPKAEEGTIVTTTR